MELKIKNLVSACDSNEQGDLVRQAILDGLRGDNSVRLDFSGISNVTSSFVNSALISLIPRYDVAAIKARIRITKVNRQIGTMINDRFRSEEARANL